MMNGAHASILDAVGGTPIVKLNRVVPADVQAEIYVKCEFMNPAGSMKDRIAINMIRAAEEEGRLKPGGTIVEATSGNTGAGLAMVAAVKGYRCVFVMPDKTSQARPAQFYVQRDNAPKAFFYPAADQTYTFVYYRIRRIQDAGAYTNTADVNFRFLPCLASGLAYYLSLKFAPDRAAALKAIYEEDFQRAALEDRDTASVQFVPDLGV
jgi:hypothetical protein